MKIAIVSGASSGMGREFAKQFDDKNLDEIWVIARREDRLKELQTNLLTPVRVFSFDLLKESSFEVFKLILKQEMPDIKYLVNAAGFGVFGDSSMDLEIVNNMIDLNIKALVNMTYICIPYMSRGSQIIELGSSSSFTPLINFNIYASTKAFVLHFSNALYQELKPKGITVTVICPGWVKTEFFKEANPKLAKHAPRFTRPLYKAEKVVNKAIHDSDRGKMISIPGAFTKVHYIKAKYAPKKVLMTLWKLMQK